MYWVINGPKKKSRKEKNFLLKKKMKTQGTKLLEHIESSLKMEIFEGCVRKKIRNSTNKRLNDVTPEFGKAKTGQVQT